tara:strand:+ start:25586 stop:26167 length:582 start_codon:yes stop_codon:yes gene_type:complete
MTELYSMDQFKIRAKIFKIFGGTFFFEDLQGNIVGYSKQKAFRLREDITLYSDASQSTALLRIKARGVIDFGMTYDIMDSQTGELIGSAKRKGIRSIFKDSWTIRDAGGNACGELKEDSIAILRRIIPLIPQKFHIESKQQPHILLRQNLNIFVPRVHVMIPPNHSLDRRLIVAVSLLILAIEGRQSSPSVNA